MANTQTTVPTFIPGQVLEASQLVNSAATGVPVFATTVTRDAGFGGAGEKALAEGQLCYLESTNVVQYYDGAAWATLAPAPAVSSGLTFIASGTVSAAAGLTMTNVFSAAYDNYLIQFTNLTTDTIQKIITMRVGTSGTADSASDYSSAEMQVFNGTLSGSESESVSGWALTASTGITGDLGQANFLIANPNAAKETTISGTYFSHGFSSVIFIGLQVFGGMKETTTQYTDWFLTAPSSFTMSATCKIYGYSNS